MYICLCRCTHTWIYSISISIYLYLPIYIYIYSVQENGEPASDSDWPGLIRTPADLVTYRVDDMAEVARDLVE